MLIRSGSALARSEHIRGEDPGYPHARPLEVRARNRVWLYAHVMSSMAGEAHGR